MREQEEIYTVEEVAEKLKVTKTTVSRRIRDGKLKAIRTNGGGQKYGRTWDKGRGISAHRKSYQLAFGSIPTGLHILHKCDTPLCVNPQHLFAGTPKDNMQDCKEKGRLADPGGHFFDGHRGKSGSANSQAKLTEAQVKEIRQLYAQGVGQHALAAQYHTTNTNISL